MRSARTPALLTLLAALGVGITAACTRRPLSPLKNVLGGGVGYVNVSAQFCTLPPQPAQEKIKYLFILDHSNSNNPGFPSPLTPNDVMSTDPQGYRRYGPLIWFVQNLVPDPNNPTYFNLIDFNDTAYQPNNITVFDPSSTNFVNNVLPDWIGTGTAASPEPVDKGFTNYQDALKMAQSLIQTDAEGEAGNPTNPIVKSVYQIIFVSDGVPSVVSTGGGTSTVYTQQFTVDIQPVIDSILKLQNDPVFGPYISSITLNTAYYFQTTQIPAAETLLQQMANEGNGQYMQFGSGENVLYQQFAPPSRYLRHILSDVFIDNENAVWWDDGQLMQDSDGDGLPDTIEQQLGSNPFVADSDGNGVSDLVEYRTQGKPCAATGCSPSGRNPYSICDGFSPTQAANGSVTFSSTSNDGLNDCEKFLLGANPDTFSSNGDFIPDWLALKNTIPFIAGTNASFADPFGDGLGNYNKLKLGLPTYVSDKSLTDFTTRTSRLLHVSSPSPDYDCYQLDVQNVAITAIDNTIKVYLEENTALIEDKPMLRTAERKISGPDTTVYFTQGDFQ